ncbi:MAG: 50S ribosomal protein L10 [archaeon]|jgi:large subunit ribosomal protein L10
MTSHTKKWKAEKRVEIAKLAKEYPIIAIATLEKLPASITSVLRKRLKGSAEVRVAKTRVVQKALKESGVDTTKIDSLVSNSVLMIFSKKNPFELFSFVKKNKGSAAAKEGDIADNDILVQAGDTGLPPGPALSTLKGAGLEVKVAGATIAISKDKVVAKKGDPIKKEVAEVLGKLNIKPIKIGMKIIGVLDKTENMFYDSIVLDIDEEELFGKFVLAYQQAMNLAVNAEVFEGPASEMIVVKAAREARALEKALESTAPAQ